MCPLSAGTLFGLNLCRPCMSCHVRVTLIKKMLCIPHDWLHLFFNPLSIPKHSIAGKCFPLYNVVSISVCKDKRGKDYLSQINIK